MLDVKGSGNPAKPVGLAGYVRCKSLPVLMIMQGCLIGAWTGLPILEGNTVRLGEERGRLRYGSTPYTLLVVLNERSEMGESQRVDRTT